MDTLLVNGDFAVDERGLPQPIQGEDELLQQAVIRLVVPRGALETAPQLGSRFAQLGQVSPQQREERALQMAQEALLPLPGVCAAWVRCEPGEAGRLTVTVGLQCGGQSQEAVLEIG